MKWKRGLFRLWVIVSLVWVFVTAVATWSIYSEQSRHTITTGLSEDAATVVKEVHLPDGRIAEFPNQATDNQIQELLNEEFPAPFPWQMVVLMVAVLLVLLLLGRAGIWIAEGFKA